MWLPKAAFYALLIGIWGAGSSLSSSGRLPSPWEVAGDIVRGLSTGELLFASAASVLRLAIGFGVSCVVGVLIGYWMSRKPFVEDTLGNLLYSVQTIPSIAYMPLIILLFGGGEFAIFFVILFAGSWPVILNTLNGLRNVPKNLLHVASTMGLSRAHRFWEVELPAALPVMITGVRLSWAFSWRALIAGELLSEGLVGLGGSLMAGKTRGDVSQMIAVLFLLAIIGLVLDMLFFRRLQEEVRKKWGLVAS